MSVKKKPTKKKSRTLLEGDQSEPLPVSIGNRVEVIGWLNDRFDVLLATRYPDYDAVIQLALDYEDHNMPIKSREVLKLLERQ